MLAVRLKIIFDFSRPHIYTFWWVKLNWRKHHIIKTKSNKIIMLAPNHDYVLYYTTIYMYMCCVFIAWWYAEKQQQRKHTKSLVINNLPNYIGMKISIHTHCSSLHHLHPHSLFTIYTLMDCMVGTYIYHTTHYIIVIVVVFILSWFSRDEIIFNFFHFFLCVYLVYNRYT